MQSNHWPTTLEEAVTELIGLLDEEGQTQLKNGSDAEFIGLHFSVGLAIRNRCGLWQGNGQLLAACRRAKSDAASSIIIKAARAKLRGEP